jgi:hypothetical protein
MTHLVHDVVRQGLVPGVILPDGVVRHEGLEVAEVVAGVKVHHRAERRGLGVPVVQQNG